MTLQKTLIAISFFLFPTAALFASVPACAGDEPATQDSGIAPEIREAQDEILMVYMNKCVQCHAVKPKKPKLNFGTDLGRLVGNPKLSDKLVVPTKPDDSDFYSAVESGDMPPEKAPQLTKAEKELMLTATKKWIMAGAPGGFPSVASATTAPATTQSSDNTGSTPTNATAPTTQAVAGAITPELADAQAGIMWVYDRKCAQCHENKPKRANLRYGKDLGSIAGNPKLVVAFKPDDSKFFSAVNGGDMPPKEAPQLTAEEKDLMLKSLKKWITAGAPVGAATAVEVADTRTFKDHAVTLIGKFHPLVAHFPIALLVGAAVAEMLWLRFRQPWLTGVVRFCTLFGALGAFGTASLGWFDGYRHPPGMDLEIHRWLGVAAAAWALPVLFLSEKGFRRRRENPVVGDPKPWFSILLFVGVALVGIAAHFGGNMVYGADYLTW